jgi:hypothetical protein
MRDKQVPIPTLSVRREFAAEHVNAILNDPSVRPFVGMQEIGDLDFGALVSDLRNYLLMADGGGFFLGAQGDGVYEVHSQFLPEARGKTAVLAAADGLRYMFVRTDAVEIVTFVPRGNVAALALTRRMGMRPALGACGGEFHRIRIEEWGARAPAMESFRQPADCCPSELRDILALTLELASWGQIQKAVYFYNRFARMIRANQLVLLQCAPLILAIGARRLLISPEKVESV